MKLYKIMEWAFDYGYIIDESLTYKVKDDRILACPICGGILLVKKGSQFRCSGVLPDDWGGNPKKLSILGEASCGFEGPVSSFLPGITRNKLERVLGEYYTK